MASYVPIPLQVQTPTPQQPVQTIGQLMNIRDMASQVALRNAQTQQATQQSQDIAQQAEQRQRDLADQSTIQEAMRDRKITEKIYGQADLSENFTFTKTKFKFNCSNSTNF